MVAVDTAPLIVNEITLIGSRCGRFEAALPLLENAGIRVEEMIVARYALQEAPEAFARAAMSGTLKVLLTV
jgi:alcohol dehydrogenase